MPLCDRSQTARCCPWVTTKKHGAAMITNPPETPEGLTYAVWLRLLENEPREESAGAFEGRALLLLTKVAAAVQAACSVLHAVQNLH
jgi:hypothetical protein